MVTIRIVISRDPFTAVGCHLHVDMAAEIVVSASSAYVLRQRASCREDLRRRSRRSHIATITALSCGLHVDVCITDHLRAIVVY